MTRDEAVTRIQRTLGYRSDSIQEVLDALKDAQQQLELGTTLPWFLKEDGSLTTTANTATVDLPDDFLRLREIEDDRPAIGTTFLRVLSRGEAVQAYEGDDAAQPRVLVLKSESVELFPTPDTVYTIHFPYYKKATVLTTNVENLWLEHAPMVLIGAAGLLVAADRRNRTAIEKFQSQLAIGWEGVHRENAQREVAGRQIVIGRKA